MFHDPKFWLAVSFTIFFVLIIKYVGPIILKLLDKNIDTITNRLKEAEEIRKKAQQLLKDAKKYHDESIKLSNQLVKDAKEESNKIIQDYKKAVKLEIDKKIESSKERINTAEERVVREIKEKIIQSAIGAIQNNVDKIADNKKLEESAKNSISQITSKLIN